MKCFRILQGFHKWGGDWGISPVTTLPPSIKAFSSHKKLEKNRENNSLLFSNNSLLLNVPSLVNLLGKPCIVSNYSMMCHNSFAKFCNERLDFWKMLAESLLGPNFSSQSVSKFRWKHSRSDEFLAWFRISSSLELLFQTV